MKKNDKKIASTTLLFIALLLFISCAISAKGTRQSEGEVIVNIPRTEGTIGSIDIKSKDFFWLLQPWKEGTLITIDGWAQFSELSFIGNDKIAIKPLVKFPNMKLDRNLITWPEANLVASNSAKMEHLFDAENGKTKSFIPYLSWVHHEGSPVLLDPVEGLVFYSFASMFSDTAHNVIYNYKEDKIVYESPPDTSIYMERAITPELIFAYTQYRKDDMPCQDYYIYNWKTEEKIQNDLTEKMTELNYGFSFGPGYTMSLEKRYFIVDTNERKKTVKIDWDEDYKNVTIFPLDPFLPEGKYFSRFFLSPSGEWATAFIGGYRGLHGELVNRRVFFRMDERYSGGISLPVFTEDYEESGWDYGSFVNHPVYGLCFAMEWHIDNQLYLRLFKMSDVEVEINRQMNEEI